MIVSTTHHIEGRPVKEYIGVVTGEAVIGANVFRDLFAGIRDVIGGRSGSYEEVFRQARTTALAEMEAEAKALNIGRDEAEADELRTALGAGGTGKGTAGTMRGAAGAIKDLEKRQKSRQTRASRDALDRALIDLATYFRDALLIAEGAGAVTANHPDMADRVGALAAHASPERLLRCIEAVLECREALATNVKPKFAVDAMVATVGQALRSDL